MFFRDIIGQETTKKKLINNITNKRVSHAQLFVGPEGSGNLGLAIAYARYLCCKAPGPDDACGSCSSCIKYNKLAHPDLNFFFPNAANKEVSGKTKSALFLPQWRTFVETKPYGNLNSWYEHLGIENKQAIINADDCNEIIKVLGFKAFESEFKVVIIWMIEKLYHSAAPKLLKILEEPPEKTLFIMVAESQDQILNTILSRAQITNIPRVKEEDIRQGLISRYNCSHEQAAHIAFLSHGSFLQALDLLHSGSGSEDLMVFFRDWMRDCYRYDPKAIVKHVEEIAKMGREKQKNLLSYALEVFRNCLLINYDVSQLVRIEGPERDFLQKFSSVFTPGIAQQMSDLYTKTIFYVERNANPKILFTDLSLKSWALMKAKK